MIVKVIVILRDKYQRNFLSARWMFPLVFVVVYFFNLDGRHY